MLTISKTPTNSKMTFMYIIAVATKSSGALQKPIMFVIIYLVVSFIVMQFENFSSSVGEDFVQIWHTLVFDNSTSTTQCVYIPIINDDCVEDRLEEFTATLQSEDGCVSIGANSTTVRIVDDDCECLYCVVTHTLWIQFTQMDTQGLLFTFELKNCIGCPLLSLKSKQSISVWLGGIVAFKFCIQATTCIENNLEHIESGKLSMVVQPEGLRKHIIA